MASIPTVRRPGPWVGLGLLGWYQLVLVGVVG
jgi:hypothetical protein